MNLEEFAKKATSYADTLDVADQRIYQEIRDREFAELIVVECINICGGHARDDGTAQRIIEDIKKYFGGKA